MASTNSISIYNEASQDTKIAIHFVFLCKNGNFSLVRYIFASLFSSLKESTYETRKNVFCFTSKGLFVLEKIKV